MGRTRHYRGRRGLEDHVGRMDVQKVKLKWPTRDAAPVVSELAGQQEKSFILRTGACDLQGFILLRSHLCTHSDNSVTGVVGSSLWLKCTPRRTSCSGLCLRQGQRPVYSFLIEGGSLEVRSYGSFVQL